MDNLELQILLDQLVEMPFLDALLKIQETDKIYKQSNFYKTTKIPLQELINKYLTTISLKYNLKQQILDLINFADTTILANKLKEILLKVLETDEIQTKIKDFSNQFDMEELLKQNEELEKIIEDLKE